MKPKYRSIAGWLALTLIPLLILLIFWFWSGSLEGPGFPLDDAWIHQSYARNLAETGQWAFQFGQPSAGSTSPLWSALLVPGYWLGLPPTVWVLVLGWLTLIGIGLVISLWLGPGRQLSPWQLGAIGAVAALEWHLVWAGLSGMETLLAGAFAMLFLWQLVVRRTSPFRLGLLLGLSVWVRPDLLSLVVPAGWFWLFVHWQEREDRFRWPLTLAAGAVLLVIPYLLMQRSLSGSFWPSTFYAKQAEYMELRAAPWIARFAEQWLAPLAGPLILLLPGVIIWAWNRGKRGQWSSLAPALWVVVYLATFATRLPVTYQHGRYAMPVIPVLLTLGLLGFIEFLSTSTRARWRWVVERAWLLTILLIAMIFTGLGAQAYALDVAIIETEMVAMAQWIDQNTEPQALIGAHDIGALGYYGNRTIVDLAGLISPEVIPIIRQQEALAEFLDRNSVDYLMTFPEWYPELVAGLEQIHTTEGRYSPAAGGTNMTLFRWD